MSSLNFGKSTVIVTGFGPFQHYKINASWEAVKLLPEKFDFEKSGINLVIAQIPVEYEETISKLKTLIEQHQPLLMIHVGVSHLAQALTLESCALKSGYNKPDVKGKTPSQEECCVGKETCLATNLNVDKLATQLNSLSTGLKFCTSDSAGLFLCEFSYYTSLALNGQNSLFIHVPDIGKPYQPEESARGIYEVICLAVTEILKCSCELLSEEKKLGVNLSVN